MAETEKKLIPLANSRPVLLRPLLLNPDEGDDNLKLIPRLRRALSDATQDAVGKPARAIFVDADEMPGAFRPTGTYTVSGTEVKMRVNLRQDGKTIASVTTVGTDTNLDGLVDALVQAILREMEKRTNGVLTGKS